MTLEELKANVRRHIGNAKTENALTLLETWLNDYPQDDATEELTMVKSSWAEFSREKRMGLLSNSDAATRQNQLNLQVLNLLSILEDALSGQSTAIKEKPKPASGVENTGRMSILMLTANPAGSTKLNLDKEHSGIVQKLQDRQDKFVMNVKKAVSKSEFKEFTETIKPYVLHFSGHGEKGKYGGLTVQNDDKNGEDLITPDGLDALFEYFKDENLAIQAVVLNACYSAEQAAIIARYVPYVIGTTLAIGDNAAIGFSVGFYFKLAEPGVTIEQVFKSGRTQAVLDGAKKEYFVLYKDGNQLNI